MGEQVWPVRHIGYVWPQRNPRAYGHHRVEPSARPGGHQCGVCGRWVVRGMGWWWETGE